MKTVKLCTVLFIAVLFLVAMYVLSISLSGSILLSNVRFG